MLPALAQLPRGPEPCGSPKAGQRARRAATRSAEARCQAAQGAMFRVKFKRIMRIKNSNAVTRPLSSCKEIVSLPPSLPSFPSPPSPPPTLSTPFIYITLYIGDRVPLPIKRRSCGVARSRGDRVPLPEPALPSQALRWRPTLGINGRQGGSEVARRTSAYFGPYRQEGKVAGKVEAQANRLIRLMFLVLSPIVQMCIFAFAMRTRKCTFLTLYPSSLPVCLPPSPPPPLSSV